MAEHPLDGRASNRSVLYSSVRREALGLSASEERQVELGGAARRLQRGRASAGRAQRRRGAFWSTNITWKSGDAAGVAVGLQLLHQPLEGQVLVGVGAEAVARGCGGAARGRRGRRARSPRRTSVLTKKPISPSSLGAGCGRRWASRRRVVLAGVAVEQHLEGGQEDHEEAWRPLPAQRLAAPSSAAGGRSQPACRRGRVGTGGRGRSVGSSSGGSAGELRRQ